MKKALWSAPALLACLILVLSGCTPTTPSTRPSSGGIIYDEYGNPIYIPPGARTGPGRTVPPGTTDPYAETGEERIGQGYDGQQEAPRIGESAPTGPIGAETAPPPRESRGETYDDGYLMAAVSPLAREANEQIRRGELDAAQATVERAIRIDAGNPELWNMMSEIQFKKGDFDQAEQMARKSNLLAAGNNELRIENWYIIAAALKQLGRVEASQEALAKARALENR